MHHPALTSQRDAAGEQSPSASVESGTGSGQLQSGAGPNHTSSQSTGEASFQPTAKQPTHPRSEYDPSRSTSSTLHALVHGVRRKGWGRAKLELVSSVLLIAASVTFFSGTTLMLQATGAIPTGLSVSSISSAIAYARSHPQLVESLLADQRVQHTLQERGSAMFESDFVRQRVPVDAVRACLEHGGVDCDLDGARALLADTGAPIGSGNRDVGAASPAVASHDEAVLHSATSESRVTSAPVERDDADVVAHPPVLVAGPAHAEVTPTGEVVAFVHQPPVAEQSHGGRDTHDEVADGGRGSKAGTDGEPVENADPTESGPMAHVRTAAADEALSDARPPGDNHGDSSRGTDAAAPSSATASETDAALDATPVAEAQQGELQQDESTKPEGLTADVAAGVRLTIGKDLLDPLLPNKTADATADNDTSVEQGVRVEGAGDIHSDATEAGDSNGDAAAEVPGGASDGAGVAAGTSHGDDGHVHAAGPESASASGFRNDGETPGPTSETQVDVKPAAVVESSADSSPGAAAATETADAAPEAQREFGNHEHLRRLETHLAPAGSGITDPDASLLKHKHTLEGLWESSRAGVHGGLPVGMVMPEASGGGAMVRPVSSAPSTVQDAGVQRTGLDSTRNESIAGAAYGAGESEASLPAHGDVDHDQTGSVLEQSGEGLGRGIESSDSAAGAQQAHLDSQATPLHTGSAAEAVVDSLPTAHVTPLLVEAAGGIEADIGAAVHASTGSLETLQRLHNATEANKNASGGVNVTISAEQAKDFPEPAVDVAAAIHVGAGQEVSRAMCEAVGHGCNIGAPEAADNVTVNGAQGSPMTPADTGAGVAVIEAATAFGQPPAADIVAAIHLDASGPVIQTEVIATGEGGERNMTEAIGLCQASPGSAWENITCAGDIVVTNESGTFEVSRSESASRPAPASDIPVAESAPLAADGSPIVDQSATLSDGGSSPAEAPMPASTTEAASHGSENAGPKVSPRLDAAGLGAQEGQAGQGSAITTNEAPIAAEAAAPEALTSAEDVNTPSIRIGESAMPSGDMASAPALTSAGGASPPSGMPTVTVSDEEVKQLLEAVKQAQPLYFIAQMYSPKAYAASVAFIITFGLWLARAIIKLVDFATGSRKDCIRPRFETWLWDAIDSDKHMRDPHERPLLVAASHMGHDIKAGLAPLVPSFDIGSLIGLLRLWTLLAEIVGTTFLLLGAIYWLFMNKSTGIGAYALWLMGSVCCLFVDFLDGQQMTPLTSASRALPGSLQRKRTWVLALGSGANLISSVFLVMGSVQWCCHFNSSAAWFWFVAALLFRAPSVTDMKSAFVTKKLQYGLRPQMLAAQVELDMHAAPSAVINSVGDLMHVMLEPSFAAVRKRMAKMAGEEVDGLVHRGAQLFGDSSKEPAGHVDDRSWQRLDQKLPLRPSPPISALAEPAASQAIPTAAARSTHPVPQRVPVRSARPAALDIPAAIASGQRSHLSPARLALPRYSQLRPIRVDDHQSLKF